MKLKDIKKELFYIRKAFFQYKKGWQYLYYKYIFAPKILKVNRRLDSPINQPDLSVHILTCHRDLVMAVWSLASYYQNSGVIGNLFIYNDGSLTVKDKNILSKFFPQAAIIDTNNFLEKYGKELLAWPAIKKFRQNRQYFLLRKLIDTYFVADTDVRLIIDSDLVWFDKALKLENVILGKEVKSLMMSNFGSCPVYFKEGVVSDDQYSKLNSGVVFYHKDGLNLSSLSDFLENIDEKDERNNHFIEQAGFAFCLDDIETLPEAKYHIKNQVQADTVVRHYTSPRRPLFYIEGISKLKNLISK